MTNPVAYWKRKNWSGEYPRVALFGIPIPLPVPFQGIKEYWFRANEWREVAFSPSTTQHSPDPASVPALLRISFLKCAQPLEVCKLVFLFSLLHPLDYLLYLDLESSLRNLIAPSPHHLRVQEVTVVILPGSWHLSLMLGTWAPHSSLFISPWLLPSISVSAWHISMLS